MKENYQIKTIIGEGAFGVTYLAWDSLRECETAIKKYHRTDPGLSECIGKIRRLEEAEEIPGLVRIHDFFSEGEDCYLVMEYFPGGTLRNYASRFRRRQIPEEELLPLLAPVMRALLCLHSSGIIHCDISPDNIMLDSEGCCHLIDLDSVKFQEDTDRKRILKEAYAAPEQYISPQSIGPWTDVYGISALLYEMLTGHKVSPGSERLREDDLLPPSSHVMISASAEQALMRGLEPDIPKRYFSVEMLMHGLGLDPGDAGIHSGEIRHRWGMPWVSISAEGTYSEGRRQNRLQRFLPKLAALAAAAALVTLAGIGGWQYYIRHNQEQIFRRKIAQAREYVREHPDRQPFSLESEGYEKYLQYLEQHGKKISYENNTGGETDDPEIIANYHLTEEDLAAGGFANNTDSKLYPDLQTARDIIFYYMDISEDDIQSWENSFNTNSSGIVRYASYPEYLSNGYKKTVRFSYSPKGNKKRTETVDFSVDPVDQRIFDLYFRTNDRSRCKLFLQKVLPMCCPETFLTDAEIDELLIPSEAEKDDPIRTVFLCEKVSLDISCPEDSDTGYWVSISAGKNEVDLWMQ